MEHLIQRKLTVSFPQPSERALAQNELNKYGRDNEPQIYRVRLAILKTCQGHSDKIAALVDGAREDHEDIIAWAERPNEMAARMANEKLTATRIEELSRLDWEQYHTWLAEGTK